MHGFVGHVAGKRGMALAVRSIITTTDAQAFQASHERIHAAMRWLVEAAERSGAIRAGTSPEDLVAAMTGFCLVTGQPGWKDRALRLVSLLVDGLRAQAKSDF